MRHWTYRWLRGGVAAAGVAGYRRLWSWHLPGPCDASGAGISPGRERFLPRGACARGRAAGQCPNLVSCPLITYQTPLVVRETSVCASLASPRAAMAIQRGPSSTLSTRDKAIYKPCRAGVFATSSGVRWHLNITASKPSACRTALAWTEVAARRLGLLFHLRVLASRGIRTGRLSHRWATASPAQILNRLLTKQDLQRRPRRHRI